MYLEEKHRQFCYSQLGDGNPGGNPLKRKFNQMDKKNNMHHMDGKPLFIDEADELKPARGNLEELHQVKCKYFPKCVYGAKCK